MAWGEIGKAVEWKETRVSCARNRGGIEDEEEVTAAVGVCGQGGSEDALAVDCQVSLSASHTAVYISALYARNLHHLDRCFLHAPPHSKVNSGSRRHARVHFDFVAVRECALFIYTVTRCKRL